MKTDLIIQSQGATKFIDEDGDNTAQAMKASGGTLVKLHVLNPNASIEYVQVFNVATGGVTVGTTTPDMIFGVPASGYSSYEVEVGFDTAITYACTDEPTGSTDPTVGLVITATYM